MIMIMADVGAERTTTAKTKNPYVYAIYKLTGLLLLPLLPSAGPMAKEMILLGNRRPKMALSSKMLHPDRSFFRGRGKTNVSFPCVLLR